MDELTKALELATLPDNEWRTLCSAMAYYLRNPSDALHPAIRQHFPDTLPTLDEWSALRVEITEVRLALDEAGYAGQQMSRNEYMRLYMKRKRLQKGV